MAQHIDSSQVLSWSLITRSTTNQYLKLHETKHQILHFSEDLIRAWISDSIFRDSWYLLLLLLYQRWKSHNRRVPFKEKLM